MSDKNPGEKLGRSSHSNSMCSDKTIGYEDKKTNAGTFVCIFLLSCERFCCTCILKLPYIFTLDV